MHSDSSAVGSALRSGRRGRAFESPLSDMNPSLRRPIIRIAMLLGAWCCGFLFYFLLGKSLGQNWTEWGLAEQFILIWQNCANSLKQQLSEINLSNETYSQVIALTLGDRSMLSPETKLLYRQAGASHILALSGMHLGIVYGAIRHFTKQLSYTNWKWVVLLLSLLFIWSYALMTGCPKSLIRAATMLSTALLLHTFGQQRKPLDILAFSASLIMLFDPAAAFDIGFQLSCAAMLGIIILGIPFLAHISHMHFIPKFILASLIISFCAQFATLPLTLHYFGTIATYSALTSLVCIPLTTGIIYTSIFLYVGIDSMVTITEYLIYIQNQAMTFISHLPGAYIII